MADGTTTRRRGGVRICFERWGVPGMQEHPLFRVHVHRCRIWGLQETLIFMLKKSVLFHFYRSPPLLDRFRYFLCFEQVLVWTFRFPAIAGCSAIPGESDPQCRSAAKYGKIRIIRITSFSVVTVSFLEYSNQLVVLKLWIKLVTLVFLFLDSNQLRCDSTGQLLLCDNYDVSIGFTRQIIFPAARQLMWLFLLYFSFLWALDNYFW